MKRRVIVLLLAGMSGLWAQERSGQAMDFDSAVKLLATTKPQNIADVQLDPNDNDGVAKGKLFDDQMTAVGVIAKSRKEVDLKVILPFISITRDLSYAAHVQIGQRRPQLPTDGMDERRAKFPVFALILDMPNAAPALEKYALDKGNPLDSRLNAFVILGYFDTERLRRVGDQLAGEIKENPSIKQQAQLLGFISGVESARPGYGFDGGVSFQ